MRPPLRRLTTRTAIAAVVLALCFVAASSGLVWWAKMALPPLTSHLGEVYMAQAEHREAAGAISEALGMYRHALNGTFRSAVDRNHCEKRMGVVLLQLGRHEEAAAHLQRAQAGPERSLNGFAPLVTALQMIGRNEDAQMTAEQWLSESATDPVNAANALQALGRMALIRDDLVAADRHLQAALSIDAHHAARALLARLYAARGELDMAREIMVDYLSTAPPNDDTAEHWRLLETWISQGPSPSE